jgi:membrane-bound lytic murein transglycosylase D
MSSAGKWVLFVALGTAASGCASSGPVRPVVHEATPAPEDPTSRLIASADARLAGGTEQSRAGHLNRAREEFDRALDLYLNAPGGAYASPRIAEAYKRTLEAIQLSEFEALAAGDGFSETLPEPAAIDDVADLPVAAASPSEEVRRVAEEALRTEANDIKIELNDAVLSCIDLYQGPLHDWFSEALARGGRYLPRIREVFQSEGIPQDLAYVALVESAFKTGALSRSKAKGVWQFMPGTGKRFGLTQDWWIDERSSPEKATRAAAQYLRSLYGMFQDWNLALAAYNAGEGRVVRSLDRNNVDDFWELARTRRGLARETKNYVPMIHAAIVVAKAPAKYGFEVTPEPLLTFDSVPVKDAVDLRVIAECAGTDLDRIQLLNPELRRLATPAGRSWNVKVPTGASVPAAECLANLPPEKRVTFRTHVVARGQTLAGLAKMYGSSPAAIADANNLGAGNRLARGAELIIPIDPRSAPRRAPAEVRRVDARPAPAEVRQVDARPADLSPAVGAPPSDDASKRITYTVRPGDTLAAIATRYKITVQQLRVWNRLRGTFLAAGDTLTVYTRRTE